MDYEVEIAQVMIRYKKIIVKGASSRREAVDTAMFRDDGKGYGRPQPRNRIARSVKEIKSPLPPASVEQPEEEGF